MKKKNFDKKEIILTGTKYTSSLLHNTSQYPSNTSLETLNQPKNTQESQKTLQQPSHHHPTPQQPSHHHPTPQQPFRQIKPPRSLHKHLSRSFDNLLSIKPSLPFLTSTSYAINHDNSSNNKINHDNGSSNNVNNNNRSNNSAIINDSNNKKNNKNGLLRRVTQRDNSTSKQHEGDGDMGYKKASNKPLDLLKMLQLRRRGKEVKLVAFKPQTHRGSMHPPLIDIHSSNSLSSNNSSNSSSLKPLAISLPIHTSQANPSTIYKPSSLPVLDRRSCDKRLKRPLPLYVPADMDPQDAACDGEEDNADCGKSDDDDNNDDDDDDEDDETVDGGARRFYSIPSSHDRSSCPVMELPLLNKQRGRFFGRSLLPHELLSWSPKVLRKALLATTRGEASTVVLCIQAYMGDRKVGRRVGEKLHEGNSFYHRPKKACPEVLMWGLVVKGWLEAAWRDEIYMQLMKQTHLNPSLGSTHLGWELVCVCLSFFPPTQTSFFLLQRLQQANQNLIQSPHQQLQRCLEVLPGRMSSCVKEGVRRGLKQPSLQEVLVAKNSIYMAGLFGSSLHDMMTSQRRVMPSSPLPWVLTSLVEAVKHLGGLSIEGIFRVSGDIDEVTRLKTEMSMLWGQATQSHTHCKPQLHFPYHVTSDATVVASLLKLWLRQLPQPLIPDRSYKRLLSCKEEDVFTLLRSHLPPINLAVLAYVVSFFKEMSSRPETVEVTKMDSSNLAMVLAPNILRSECTDARLMLECAKKEITFVRLLINSWPPEL